MLLPIEIENPVMLELCEALVIEIVGRSSATSVIAFNRDCDNPPIEPIFGEILMANPSVDNGVA